MRSHSSDMFHDKTAHDLERRFMLVVGFAFVIGLLHWILNHAV